MSKQANPATLVAILIAARRAKNQDLEREIRRRLLEEFGVKLQFARPAKRGSEANGK